MKNLLIGSRAMAFWNGLETKPETDWDVISEKQIDGTEWHNPDLLLNSEIEQWASNNVVSNGNGLFHVVLPIGLALIKRSHLWRDLSFGKHITHYHKHLKVHLDNANDHELEYLERRTNETKRLYPAYSPNLNQSVADFFDDGVKKKYVHDYLHELFAYQNVPMYTRLQTDHSRAWCKKELWDKLNETEKRQCVAEECYVIAAERYMIPADWDFKHKIAYNRALEKVCTTLCSGYFRDYAIENFPVISGMFDVNKFNDVKEKLND